MEIRAFKALMRFCTYTTKEKWTFPHLFIFHAENSLLAIIVRERASFVSSMSENRRWTDSPFNLFQTIQMINKLLMHTYLYVFDIVKELELEVKWKAEDSYPVR